MSEGEDSSMKWGAKKVGGGILSGIGKYIVIGAIALFGGGFAIFEANDNDDESDDRPTTSQVREDDDDD